MYSADPNLDFLEHDAEAEHWLERRPVCCLCGHHIQEDIALKLDGEWICDDCVSSNRKWIENYDE